MSCAITTCYDTVGSTFSWTSPAWHLRPALLSQLKAWDLKHEPRLACPSCESVNMFAGSLRIFPLPHEGWLCGVCIRFLSVFCISTRLGLGMCCAWALPLSNIGRLFLVRIAGDGCKPWHKIPTQLICSAGVIRVPVAVALLGTSGLSVFSLTWIGLLVLLTAMAGTPWLLGSFPWFCMHCVSRA